MGQWGVVHGGGGVALDNYVKAVWAVRKSSVHCAGSAGQIYISSSSSSSSCLPGIACILKFSVQQTELHFLLQFVCTLKNCFLIWHQLCWSDPLGPLGRPGSVEHWHWYGLSNLLKQNPEIFLIALCPFKSGYTQNVRKYAYIFILGCTFAEKYKRCYISCGNGTIRH